MGFKERVISWSLYHFFLGPIYSVKEEMIKIPITLSLKSIYSMKVSREHIIHTFVGKEVHNWSTITMKALCF